MSRSWVLAKVWIGALSLALALGMSTAAFSADFFADKDGGQIGAYGDGDVFPHSCVNFSGQWRADDGGRYRITQLECEYVGISLVDGVPAAGSASFIDLVPNNKYRPVCDADFNEGVTRHQWNSLDYGSLIRTWTRFNYADRVVYEERQYEFVSRDMMLESVYRYVDVYGGSEEDHRDNHQRIFRRIRGDEAAPVGKPEAQQQN